MYKKRNAFRDLASEPETRVGGIISQDTFFSLAYEWKIQIFFFLTSIGTMGRVVKRSGIVRKYIRNIKIGRINLMRALFRANNIPTTHQHIYCFSIK